MVAAPASEAAEAFKSIARQIVELGRGRIFREELRIKRKLLPGRRPRGRATLALGCANMREVPDPEGGTGKGKPIGRRVVLGMAGIGALGVVFGAPVDGWVADVLQPLSSGTGSGIADLIPGSDYFQLYTVTSGFPVVPPRLPSCRRWVGRQVP